MSQTVVVNGVSYDIPDVGEDGWGQNVTDYLVALSVVAGATPALINVVSVTTTPVSILVGRTYLVDTSSAKTLQLPTPTSNFFFIVRDVTGSAATNNITIARNGSESIDGVAANKTLSRPYGTWLIASNGTNWFTLNQFPDTGIINADIASAAAIAYSKLNLSTSIVNADVAVGAAVALSKLATVTASRVIVSDGSGVFSASSISATTLSYLDATSSIQTQINGKQATLGFTPVNIAGDTMTGPLLLSAGSVSAPSLSFAGDVNTGLYHYGADKLGFTTGGVGRGGVISDGTLIITDTPTDMDISSGTSAGSIVSGHNRFFRSVNAAHTSTIRLIGINTSNALIVGGEPANTPIFLNGGSGHVRMDNTSQLNWRNGADNADLRAMDVDSGNNLNIGRDDSIGDIQIFGRVIFYDDASSPSEIFRVGSDGRIFGSSAIYRALSTTPDSTSGTTAYIESGTFTPTGTNGTNVTAVTPGPATWIRVGRAVTISGQVSITTTAAVSSTCDLSFPINSGITADTECSGVFSSLVAGSGRIVGNATNDRATFEWTAAATASNSYRYTYTYLVN